MPPENPYHTEEDFSYHLCTLENEVPFIVAHFTLYLPPTTPFHFLQAIQHYFITTWVIICNLKVHVPEHPSNSIFYFFTKSQNQKRPLKVLSLAPCSNKDYCQHVYVFCKPLRMDFIHRLCWPAPTLPASCRIPCTILVSSSNTHAYKIAWQSSHFLSRNNIFQVWCIFLRKSQIENMVFSSLCESQNKICGSVTTTWQKL